MAKSSKLIRKDLPKPISGQTVNEPAIAYAITAPYKKDFAGISYWLGFSEAAAKKIVSDFDYIRLGAAGLTKTAIDVLASHIGISKKFISEDIFDVSVRTIERKSSSEKLDKKTSSHAIEIAKVVQHAYEVFRDEEKVKRWLNKENRALNDLKPVNLFATLSGLIMVDDILGRIQEGVYS